MELSHDKADLNLLSESPTTAMIVIIIYHTRSVEKRIRYVFIEKETPKFRIEII